MRIRPYKNQENRIDGAVLTFMEVDEPVRESADALRQFIHAVVNSVSAGVLVLGEDLRIQAANEALLKIVGISRRTSVRGRTLRELGGSDWDGPMLAAPLDRLRTNGEPFAGVELKLSRPRKRTVTVDATRLPGTNVRLPLLVLTVRAESGDV